MSRLYLFTLEIVPLELEKAYNDLPSHVTLMSRFTSDLAPDELASVVKPLFSDTKSIHLLFGNTIKLGPKKVTAHMIDSPDEHLLHERLLGVLKDAGVVPQYPQFIGADHRAHVTQRDGVDFPSKTHLMASVVYLIEVINGQRIARSRLSLV